MSRCVNAEHGLGGPKGLETEAASSLVSAARITEDRCPPPGEAGALDPSPSVSPSSLLLPGQPLPQAPGPGFSGVTLAVCVASAVATSVESAPRPQG